MEFYLKDILFLAIAVYIYGFVILGLKKRYKFGVWIFYLGLVYHLSATVAYYIMCSFDRCDANHYCLQATEIDLSLSNKFIYTLAYPFRGLLGLSCFSTYVVFGMIGFIGLALFYIAVLENANMKDRTINRLTIMVMFLPGIHFWSSSIGKDSVFLFSIGLLLFSLSNIRKRGMITFFSLTLMLFIRPYMFVISSIALGLSFLTSKSKINIVKKIGLTYLLAIVILFSYMIIFNFYMNRYSFTELQDIKNFFDERKSIDTVVGSSSYQLEAMSPVIRIITFMYGPFFDSGGILYVAASVENLILVIATLAMASPKLPSFLKIENSLFFRFNLFYFILSVLFLSNVVYNLGLAMRLKTMVLPSFWIIFLMFKSRK
ncbi:MAG: hypothetical protein KKD39_01205 [Candidatus Altiarchaeota archaeon]|nr:hypothetical protein [Candidatus Altiarchaeota archaeon]